ncbi:MAG TPA: adenosylcobalamin-dependent ribonucleoside-diphosphate reductase [Patescibacteria group bacterium]|nr:adenosylcobalamin-dependent ribonucleoside-diphosphate reductase [Patescibacteria group bacterium]
MKLTGVAEKVFIDRYSLKDKQGKPLEKNPDQMWRRVAHAVATVEKGVNQKKWEKHFYQAMQGFKYVPGGRILAGAGTGYMVTFYNCFVIPSPGDSRQGILDTLKQMVEIMAHGGGVGINISSLRPKGARVRKVNGFSSGPCNWAELFSLATKDIIQQGGTRRGALMLMLWDWHPDIEEFITVKQDLSRINGANLSLCISDSFMKAVEKDEDWQLMFPDTNDPEYDAKWDGDLEVWKKLGKKMKIIKTVKARKIWDLIASAAWKSAEPGVVFMERYNKWHNNYYWNRINCVNPCGEEGLPPWGVCNLGSINLSALVNVLHSDKKGRFDFVSLKKIAKTAVRFQDNIIDMDPYVFDGIRKTQLEGERRIGLGTMGLGDCLIKLQLRYGSDKSLTFIDKVYRIIRDAAYEASCEIAKEKGSFPKFDASLFSKSLFIQELDKELQDTIKKHGIRNSVLLMQAPTGSTSLLAGTTSGIEPVYEFEFIRKDRLGIHTIRHILYESWYQKNKTEIKAGKAKKPLWFVSSNELTPEDHVKVQSVIQKYVDASISKTVNAPKTHTVDDVKKLYTMAYKLGLKGIAYMRDGSRPGVLERVEKNTSEKSKKDNGSVLHHVKPRPMVVHGSTYKINTPVGTAFITINTNGDQEPLEVFVNVGKAGSDVYAMAEGLGRVVSLALRFSSQLSPHERIQEIINQLQGIGGARTLGFGRERVRSLPDALAKILGMHFKTIRKGDTTSIERGNGATKEKIELVAHDTQPSLLELEKSSSFDICPSCGEAAFAHEEGCKKCYGCGFSEC